MPSPLGKGELRKRLKPNIVTCLKFYDHCYVSDCDDETIDEKDGPILELVGHIVSVGEVFVNVKIVSANYCGNSEYWKVIKSAIIEAKPVYMELNAKTVLQKEEKR